MDAVFVEYQTCTDTDKGGFYEDTTDSRHDFTIKENINKDGYRVGLEFVTEESKYSKCKTAIGGGRFSYESKTITLE